MSFFAVAAIALRNAFAFSRLLMRSTMTFSG
jgi:hypothetical protein